MMLYIDTLIENCKKAKLAKSTKEFVLKDISELNSIKNAIYVIEEINGDNKKTFNDFLNYKKLKERACPKSNSPSQIMYVGSSSTGVKKRIQQHLGYGPKSTYALHLNHWFKGQYQITIKVFEESLEVIQILEDALSKELSPAFGKRGGNNK